MAIGKIGKKIKKTAAKIGGKKGGGLLAGKLGVSGLGAKALGGGTGLLVSTAVDALGRPKKEEKDKNSELLDLLTGAAGGLV